MYQSLHPPRVLSEEKKSVLYLRVQTDISEIMGKDWMRSPAKSEQRCQDWGKCITSKKIPKLLRGCDRNRKLRGFFVCFIYILESCTLYIVHVWILMARV